MIPVLNVEQIRAADQYTIENEPIPSIDLMERASAAFVEKFCELEPSPMHVTMVCGTGNNGGDGLAIARLLCEKAYHVDICYIGEASTGSEDFKVNFQRLPKEISVIHIEEDGSLQALFESSELIIDAIFGSGLSRPVEGLYARVIEAINNSPTKVYSVDMPSGLFADKQTHEGEIVCANHTISFQTPKLTFFQPDSFAFTGHWHVVDIGLDPSFINKQYVAHYYTQAADVRFPIRSKFDHKGKAGRLLMVCGSKGKMGAAILSARAAMRAGAGLLTIHAPTFGMPILQSSVPEGMVIADEHAEVISEVDVPENIDAIGMGPGIGTSVETMRMLEKLLNEVTVPLVIDADGINILSEHRELLEMLPPGTILTPHPGEFQRLVGEWRDDFEKLKMLKSFCKRHHVNVVLKGAYSAVCSAEGTVYFNPTGNPGMATAGSGDVLTGIIAALLAQGFSPFEALRSGVFLHGKAGDLAAESVGHVSMIASDIIAWLPQITK